MGASAVVNCQCTGVGSWWRARAQAVSSVRNVFQIRDALLQALQGQDTQFDFGDVESAAMLGSMADLQARRHLRHLGRKRRVQGIKGVGVEVVDRQDYPVAADVAGSEDP